MKYKENGVTISDKPYRILGEVEDLKGKQFGYLTVTNFDHKDKNGKAIWKCQCDCGNTCLELANSLKRGLVISCGHINRQKAAQRMKKMSTIHNASREPWFSNYSSMVTRATNPNDNDKKYYNHDQINGPMIEPSWLKNPWNFYQEIGPKPDPTYSIHRINPKLGYVKGNVKWASKSEQALNREKHVKTESNYQNIIIEKAGINRRAHNRYTATATINGKRVRLKSFYVLNNALRYRYDYEKANNLIHTFDRPSGPYEIEPNYNQSEHPGIYWSKSRQMYRVYVGKDRVNKKYIGQTQSLEEARQMQAEATEQLKTHQQITLSHQERHHEGIIGIDPDGNKHYYNSVAEAKKKLNTKANIFRHLKDGQPFTRRRSSLYGWTFKYND